MAMVLKQPSVLPGFGLTLGFALFYFSLIVLIPLSTIFLKTASLSVDQFWATVTAPRALAAYELSFGASLVGATINVVFGLLVVWFGLAFAYKFLMSGLKVWKEYPGWVSRSYTGASISAEVSPELLGVGYIIGPRIAGTLGPWARPRRCRTSAG